MKQSHLIQILWFKKMLSMHSQPLQFNAINEGKSLVFLQNDPVLRCHGFTAGLARAVEHWAVHTISFDGLAKRWHFSAKLQWTGRLPFNCDIRASSLYPVTPVTSPLLRWGILAAWQITRELKHKPPLLREFNEGMWALWLFRVTHLWVGKK